MTSKAKGKVPKGTKKVAAKDKAKPKKSKVVRAMSSPTGGQWAITLRPRSVKDLLATDALRARLQAIVDRKLEPKTIIISGPSGSGKTTAAMLIAESLSKGHKADVIEHDCASKGNVDDIRGLLSESQYLPAKPGAKRVVILDEAHMMTAKSASPLLKPLEDPEPHLVWILCTDQPHKMLKTLGSRAMRLHFDAPSPGDAVAALLDMAHGQGALPNDWSVSDIKLLAAAAVGASGGNFREAIQLLQSALVSISSLGCADWKEAQKFGVLPTRAVEVDEAIMALLRETAKAIKKGADLKVLRALSGLNPMDVLEGVISAGTNVLLGRAKADEDVPLSVYAHALRGALAARDAIMTIPASSYYEANARMASFASELMLRAGRSGH